MAPFTPLSGVARWRRVVPGAVRVHLRREVAGPGHRGGGGGGGRGGRGVGGEQLPGRAQGRAGAAGGDLRQQQPHPQTARYRWVGARQSKNICPLNKHYLCRAEPRGGRGRAGAARRAGDLPGHLQRAPHQAHGPRPRPRQGTPQGEPRPAQQPATTLR